MSDSLHNDSQDIACLPVGTAPKALRFPHFPDALHAVVWRNWHVVPVSTIARVVGATPAQVRRIAASMGLPPARRIGRNELRRNYIAVIRRNWHLLPYSQLLALLGWDAEKLAFTLREDDFLWHKLGSLKPACDPVRYAPPSPAARRQAAWIRGTVAEHFGAALSAPSVPPFAFLAEFAANPGANLEGEPPVVRRSRVTETKAAGEPLAGTTTGNDGQVELRFLYSYSALYGDPLLEPDCDPYPEGLLAMLADAGVNGVWLQGILHKLAPWSLAPELSAGYQERRKNLRHLVARARRYGIGVYLYLNEPRAMPPTFFAKYPHLRGVEEEGFAACCTSTPEIRKFLRSATASVFAAVPDLAGAFTISASENLTNCWSHMKGANCPRCGQRRPAEVVAEANRCIAEGVWQSAPHARFLAWDWGWQDEWAEEAIGLLPERAWLMSVSEWSLPIERGGVRTEIGEYSISSVGPGPRARRHWAAARRRGLKVAAKVQISNTWELASLPYVPVPHLVARHMSRLLAGEGGAVPSGLMLTWTLGGYPSPSLAAACRLLQGREADPDTAVRAVAEERFGKHAADPVVAAWKRFAQAFAEYPYHVGTVYCAPQQVGPANLLFRAPTGYSASMVGFPYDDLDRWRAVYPPDVFRRQFEIMAECWEEGLRLLEDACRRASSPALTAECRVAAAAGLHLRSVANQIAFVQQRGSDWGKCQEILRAEIATARRMFDLVSADSRLGFEATNHYYYTRLDFVEKVLNCRWLADRFNKT